jgi:haloalkane dehalogenase
VAPALDELAAPRTCIAPDLMSLGYTEARAGQDLSFEAQPLAAFLDRRAIGQVDLVGKDTGVSARSCRALPGPGASPHIDQL